MRTLCCTLIFFIWLSVSAFALPSFQVSCGNVHSINIDKQYNHWRIAIELLPDGHSALEQLAARHKGEHISLKAGDKELMRALAPFPVCTGRIELQADTKDAAYAMAKSICRLEPRELSPGLPKSMLEYAIPEDRSESVIAPTFPVDCSTVSNMKIFGFRKDYAWRQHEKDSFVYALQVEMSEPAGKEFLQFYTLQKPLHFVYEGAAVLPKKYVQLSAQNQRIRSDVPFLDYFGIQGARISKNNLHDAVSAAQLICSEKLPFAASSLNTGQGDSFVLGCDTIESLTACGSTGFKTLSVQLTPQAEKDFHQLTQRNLGNSITLRSPKENLGNGPTIVPVTSGRIDFDTASEEQANKLGKQICASKFKRTELPTYKEIMNGPRVVEHPENIDSPTFPISCGNVESMRFWTIKDKIWNKESIDGYLYQLIVKINKKTGNELMALLAEAEPTQFEVHGITIPKKHVQLLAQGEKIISHTPLSDLFNESSALITLRTPEDATHAAQTICAEKAPTKFDYPSN